MTRVLFDTSIARAVPAELDRLGRGRAVVLTTAGQAAGGARLAAALGPRSAGTYAGAVMHTPVAVTEDAVAHVRRLGGDALVSLGGGSTIGLGKAVALRTDLPHIAVPTTYAGSEATPILGETAGGRKTTVRDPKLIPAVVIYDVELTLTLDVGISVASGLNAIAHAVEALYAGDRTPAVSQVAEEGIAAFVEALPILRRDARERDARSRAQRGAWACGSCLGMAGMALHHKICHVLGGTFGLPHASTHAVVLPYAVEYNERAAATELALVARMLGSPSAADGLRTFARSLDAPASLRELGLRETDLDRAVELLLESPYWNPQPLVREELRALLDAAYFGR